MIAGVDGLGAALAVLVAMGLPLDVADLSCGRRARRRTPLRWGSGARGDARVAVPSAGTGDRTPCGAGLVKIRATGRTSGGDVRLHQGLGRGRRADEVPVIGWAMVSLALMRVSLGAHLRAGSERRGWRNRAGARRDSARWSRFGPAAVVVSPHWDIVLLDWSGELPWTNTAMDPVRRRMKKYIRRWRAINVYCWLVWWPWS